MSLRIDPDFVRSVLLADGWHPTEKGTFDVDAYEFTDGDDVIGGGGIGFRFTERDGNDVLLGPLSSIIAIDYEMDG